MTWQSILKQAGYPTTALVLDFETYFNGDYSIKKMSTVEYVCDKRFEITGLGVESPQRFGPVFLDPKIVSSWLQLVQDDFGKQFENCTIIGQNLKFDCLILKEHFGITPRYTVDLIDLDRIWDARDKHNLAHMAKKWKAPKPKGLVDQFKGLHWADMDADKRQALEEYCKGDVEIESYLFQKLLPLVPNPHIELLLATQTLHLFLNSQIEIDFHLGGEIKAKMEAEKQQAVRATGHNLKTISGNKSFVKLLNTELSDNEQVPMKQGKNGMIAALAREDEGMQYLLNHKNPKVSALSDARLAVRSWPLHIARVENLMDQAHARSGQIGAPISYYAAHTGRWGGTEGINLQNLGGRGRGKPIHPLIGQVRQMLKAPDGSVFGIGDYAQIEARILAWLAGQNDLVKGFANGEDIYSQFATKLFGRTVRKPTKEDSESDRRTFTIQRGFGKDAILGCGYGMGTNTFYERCRANPELRPTFDSGQYNWDFIDRLIKTYRTKYVKIPKFWRQVEKAWRFVTKYPKEIIPIGPWATLLFWHKDKATFINLPSGRFIRYPYASVNTKGDLLYRWGKLWGGSITENIVQAVARDILAEALLRLEGAGYNILLTVHDEIICLFDKSIADLWLKGMLAIMSQQPVWAVGLPIAVEGKLAERYEK